MALNGASLKASSSTSHPRGSWRRPPVSLLVEVSRGADTAVDSSNRPKVNPDRSRKLLCGRESNMTRGDDRDQARPHGRCPMSTDPSALSVKRSV